MKEKKETNYSEENAQLEAKGMFQLLRDRFFQLPAWLVVSIIAIFFLILFCIVPFLFIDIFNQWCNLFPGFFNAMSPGICP